MKAKREVLSKAELLLLYSDIMDNKTDRELALKFRKSRAQISRIRNGKNWKEMHTSFFKDKIIPKSLNRVELSLEEMFKVIELCEQGLYTDSEISLMIDRDKSLVNRVRNRELRLNIWKQYDAKL